MRNPAPLFLCLALLGAGPVAAQAPRAPEEVVQAGLLTGWKTPDGGHMAALQLQLADHWKTYWRAPGDAGIPPRFDWTGSANLARVVFHWPRPEVFELDGERSVGYLHHLVLPIEFVPKDASKPVAVKAKVDIGVCNDICMPVELSLSAELSGAGQKDPRIETALAEAPVSARAAGVTSVRCEVSAIKDGLHLTARIAMPRQGGGETALFETADPSIWVGGTGTTRQGGVLVAGADLVPSAAAPFALDRSGVRITVLGKDRAVEIDGCPAG